MSASEPDVHRAPSRNAASMRVSDLTVPSMANHSRVIALVLIMATALALVTVTTIWFLYRAAFRSISDRLVESAQSQARLIEAIAREEMTHGEMYEGRITPVVLAQIVDAHKGYRGHGETSEFALARREGDEIVFLLGHHHDTVEPPDPVPVESALAEPMRRALTGRSGTMVGLDYDGTTVVAAYEPVTMVDDPPLGIVAKIDLAEVRAPFVTAGLLAIGFSLLVAGVGAILVVRISQSFVTQIRERSQLIGDMVAALAESEEKFRSIFTLAGAGIAQVDLDGRFADANDRYCEILGYERRELINLTFQDVTHPEDLAADLEHARQLLSGEVEGYSMDKRYLRKDGSVVWVHLNGSIVRSGGGEPRCFIAVVEDISAQKEADAAVKTSLAEKEVLLREIHHRVKNNMQVISSLLSLQATAIDEPRLQRMFQDSRSRVKAMALVHEVLYDSSDLSGIDLREYLTRLTSSLARMYGFRGGHMRVEVEPAGLKLKIDATVPSGLAINELISNSVKHGHPDGGDGEVGVRVSERPDGDLEFTVWDDGVGMPAGTDVRKLDSMGMSIVVALVEKQLGGRLRVDSDGGTRVTFTIPKERATT